MSSPTVCFSEFQTNVQLGKTLEGWTRRHGLWIRIPKGSWQEQDKVFFSDVAYCEKRGAKLEVLVRVMIFLRSGPSCTWRI